MTESILRNLSKKEEAIYDECLFVLSSLFAGANSSPLLAVVPWDSRTLADDANPALPYISELFILL
jgi:hypothetical protein